MYRFLKTVEENSVRLVHSRKQHITHTGVKIVYAVVNFWSEFTHLIVLSDLIYLN